MSNYRYGTDVIGGDFDLGSIASFIPALNVVSQLTSGGDKKGAGGGAAIPGLGTGTTKPAAGSAIDPSAIQKAIEQERARQEKVQAEKSAKRTRLILYSVLGVVGIGGAGLAVWAIARKR